MALEEERRDDVITSPHEELNRLLDSGYSDTLQVERIISTSQADTYEKFHEYVWLRNAGKFHVFMLYPASNQK